MCGCGGTQTATTWVVVKGGVQVYEGDEGAARSYAVVHGGTAQKKP